jgi:hypothetical protein
MAVYEPIIPNVPPWLMARIQYMGLAPAAAMCRSLAASATSAGDTTSATAFNLWNTTIQRSRNYPGGASARNTFMVIAKK